MYISNNRNVTANSLLSRVDKEARKGFNPLAKSSKESVELLKKVKPRLYNLMYKYIYRDIKGQIAKDDGTIEEISTLRKLIVKEFKFTDKELQALMPYTLLQHQSCLYNFQESFYDMSLLVEQGARSNLIKDKNFESNIRRLGEFEYITQVLGCVFYIDKYSGVILRFKKRFEDIVDIKVDTYWGNVDVLTADGKVHRVCEGRRLIGKWVIGDKDNKDGSKVYRKIEVKPTQKQLAQGETTFNMRSHHAIAICHWGYDVVKHCRGSASLLSIDHISKNSKCNSYLNLRIISRVLNNKDDTSNQYIVDWGNYYKKVYGDMIDYKENKEYFDYFFTPAV